MNKIHVLDGETIDKIAAGEVVERPASVVKELVENAIDAGATSITVEIKDGGISFIRITDNGSGIAKDQIRTAFLRHATSKIANAEDLNRIASLGFRGEALSSIAAVSRVELITKTRDELTGIRLLLEGSQEKSFEEIGAPEGTTFIVRNLFFNVPVRRNFLKQPATEGGYIIDLMEHLALSRPDISFKFIVNGQVKFYTSGNGELKEVIYRIFGRDVAGTALPIDHEEAGFAIKGYLGSPSMVRSNRNFEIYFVNGRFIRSQILSKAIEEGYKEYLMQHKFPLCVLHMTVEDKSRVDVNVHPTKMEVRFSDGQQIYQIISKAVAEALRSREMIPEVKLPDEKGKQMHGNMAPAGNVKLPDGNGKQMHGNMALAENIKLPDGNGKQIHGNVMPISRAGTERASLSAAHKTGSGTASYVPKNHVSAGNGLDVIEKVVESMEQAKKEAIPEPFERNRTASYRVMEEMQYEADRDKMRDVMQKPIQSLIQKPAQETGQNRMQEPVQDMTQRPAQEYVQGNLFEDKILTLNNRKKYTIVGQVFDTYWLVQFEDKLLIIDQHAAHEKVKYERLIRHYREKQVESQNLLPPVIVSLTGQESAVLREYQHIFEAMGFQVEEFGGNEYTLRSVPMDLFGCNEKQMFLEVLDELADVGIRGNLTIVEEKIASMSCKAAVKGNQSMNRAEAEYLIDELLTLENPYNCPHGRPTIITMSKYEMEKRFKR